MARWRDAARRWRARSSERSQKQAAVRQRRYTEADSVDRIAKRLTRLQAWVLATREENVRPVRREDVTDELVERVVGTVRDLLSIEFFELGLLAARCVGRVVTNGEANGTGFLVAPGLMLTNQHVLRDPGEAARSEFELDFEANQVGEPKRMQIFTLLPRLFFLNDKELDFALVAVETTSQQGAQLSDFGMLPLIGAEGKVRIGEAVNVVQHPGGHVKQVVIRNNWLVDLPEGADLERFFHYEANTEKGSSGSPVFNDQWEVVALHHSGVPKMNEKDELIDADGNVLHDKNSPRIVWVANEGIRISRIVDAVSKAQLSPEMTQIRDDALATWQLRGQPAVAKQPDSIRRPEYGKTTAATEAR